MTGVSIDAINDMVSRKVIGHRIVGGTTIVFPYPEVIAAAPFKAAVDAVKNSSPAIVEPDPVPEPGEPKKKTRKPRQGSFENKT
jgi:hypothetical protein